MKRLILIRHAETDMAGTFCGHSDPPLNRRGREQLATLDAAFANREIDYIVSSDLVRAQQTAAALQSQHSIPVITDRELREIYFGVWEGLSWHEIESRFPDESLAWLQHFPEQPAPGGERYAEFCSRVKAALDRAVAGAGQNVAIITHAGVIRVALQHLMEYSYADAQERHIGYGTWFVHEVSNT